MISPVSFVDTLEGIGIDFYAGVPDSLLQDLCTCITERLDAGKHIIAADEGAAVALAAGHYLATGRPGCVYLQNSGEGHIINPLASLTDPDVYGIPVLLLIGWRGRPGVPDEPQHSRQGRVTTALLEVMGVDYELLSPVEDHFAAQVERAAAALRERKVFAFVIEKDTFEYYKAAEAEEKPPLPLGREEAIQTVSAAIGEKDCIVSSTGMISRELFDYRSLMGEGHERDFLTVGSMGHASQIALGIALAQPQRRIWCFDGDGAVIMHLGSLAVLADKSPGNLIHVVFNNGAHDSVGGQPTVGLKMDLPGVARAMGYPTVRSASNKADLLVILSEVKNLPGPVFIEVKVRKGHRSNLGRPTTTPAGNKEALMNFLKGPCL